MTEPGRYVVTHTELSTDGDIQTEEWFFVLDPTSENRIVPIGTATLGDGGPNWILLLGGAGVVMILAGLLWPKKSSTSVEQNLA